MAAWISFVDWINRFSNEEFSLLRHKMRGVQWMGPNIQRRWDTAIATNTVDLDDPLVVQFVQALVDQNVILQRQVVDILSHDGTSPTPPVTGAGAPGPAGADGTDGTSMLAGAGAPTQDAPVGTIYLDSATGDLYQFSAG